MAAPFPPPAIAPMIAPRAAPPPILAASLPFDSGPILVKLSVDISTRCPSEVLNRVSSSAMEDKPLTLPACWLSTTRPSARAPFSAITKPSTTSGASSDTVNVSPGWLRSLETVSTKRTGKSVPACRVTSLAGGGGGGATGAGGSAGAGAGSTTGAGGAGFCGAGVAAGGEG